MRLDKLVKATVSALEDIKGRDIVVLDVRRMTALFDRIILATGYKPSLSRVPFLAGGALVDAIETRNASPVLDDTMQSSVPGLFFTSMLATDTFGPFFAFTVSARAAARLIARGIEGRTA